MGKDNISRPAKIFPFKVNIRNIIKKALIGVILVSLLLTLNMFNFELWMYFISFFSFPNKPIEIQQ